MSPPLGAKQYVDRAIQTEAQDSLSGLESGPTISAEHASKVETDAAYTHWHSLTTLSKGPSVAAPPLIQSPSASTSHRTSKRPQLLYNRPVEPHVLAKRIVSLPESPLELSRDRRTAHDVTGMRIVSLPEPIRCSPQSRDSSSYLDSFGMSGDPSIASLGSDLGHLRFCSYLRDVPRTPSPPYSPSSTLIIDNEVRLPTFCLYQERQNHKITVTEDDGGWTTWASSPPRPIPALHGPSSLPYARCPSGAEGIIFEEDADLPRMIWGLDLEGFPPNDSRKQRTINVHKPTTEGLQSALQTAHQISKEHSSAIYSLNSEICLPGSRHNYPAGAVLRRDPTFEGLNGGISRDSTVQLLGPPLNQHHAYNLQENRTVNWRETSYVSASKFRTINERPLSPSASIFAPATSEHISPRTTMEFCASTIVKPRTLAAIDIARQYCLDQQKNTLPTPPTSSAPQWSPVFSGPAPFSPSGEERDFLDDQQASKLSPARTFSGTVYPEERRFVDSYPAGRSLGLQDMPPPSSNWKLCGAMRRRSPSNQFPHGTKILHKTSLCSGPPPGTSSLYPNTINRTTNLTSTGSSDPPRRISVPRTHPKQWRLSSVVEEDSGTGSNSVSLPLQSRQHVYAARRGPSSGCVAHISDADHAFTGFDDLRPNTSDIAEVPFDSTVVVYSETACNKLALGMKPTVEPMPTVKLPLKATMSFGRQDKAGVCEEMGTHFSHEKENASNIKKRDKTLPKRGRARKRNMNTMLDDSQKKMPK